jgi:hypothetical protein
MVSAQYQAINVLLALIIVDKHASQYLLVQVVEFGIKIYYNVYAPKALSSMELDVLIVQQIKSMILPTAAYVLLAYSGTAKYVHPLLLSSATQSKTPNG